MSWDEFVEGLYKIEDPLFPRLVLSEKFTINEVVIKNRPKRMFRLEGENALDRA